MPAVQLLILVCLIEEDRHGYGILTAAREAGDDLNPSGIYQALDRLQHLGLVEMTDRPAAAPSDPRRQYYRITHRGRAAVVRELDRLHAVLERAAAAGIDRRAWRSSGPTGRGSGTSRPSASS